MENQISKSIQWSFSGYKSCLVYLQIERRTTTTTATAATAEPRQRQLSTTTTAATTP